MTIKTIIFDAGGVLFLHDWYKLKSHIMKEHNFSILLYSDHPKKIQNKYKGLNIGKTSFKKVLSGLSGQKDIDLILRDYEKGYKKYQWLNSRLLIFLKKIKIQKPDKRAFLAVLKDNHLNPEEVLFVDDQRQNLDVARKLGMNTLIFKNNKKFFKDLKKFGIK